MKFLYCISSELWGHREIPEPGNEDTRASEVGAKLAKPLSKPKTAYEMITGDWSSDVCSSDLFPE